MIKKLIFLVSLIISTQTMAHHSFAIYDFATQVPFDGVVDTIKFRNPHIEMTLKIINVDGEEEIIHFIEGAPANMMVRSGVRPAMMSPGTKLHAVGSPLIEDSTKYFLRSIRTEDGTVYAN
ncbi:MAG: DUF6152 family protein [Gammaproteobacteria bacterium]|nr:DUF6152 family protein [Gammaproteobacteria bacterium]